MQGFANQALGNIRSIGIGSVDEVHAEFGQALQGAQRFCAVGGFSQMPRPVIRIAPNPSG